MRAALIIGLWAMGAGCAGDLGPATLADQVVEAPGATGMGFGDPWRAVNGVRGAGRTAGSQDVFSLGYSPGVDDSLVLRWSGRRVVDGPGVDFVVFENPFETAPGAVFMEPVIVEVSEDAATWVAFPHDYRAPDESRYSSDPRDWQGFAGVTPVELHAERNPVDPFDAETAGGDGFDLATLPSNDAASRALRERGFVYLRLVAAPSRPNPDTGARFVHAPAATGADIDGVHARTLAPE